MERMRVLITNHTLSSRTGTELYTQELALALLEQGHTPIVYSTQLGGLAQELRNKTVPVVDDLDFVSATPDIIHGQHSLATMTALLRFPSTPALYFFHNNLSWEDVPPRFPRIMRYVAVDDTCRDRLVLEYGIPEGRVRVLHNSVDLSQFKPRPPLPAKPARALAFGNYDGRYLAAVREACERAGLALDIVGMHSGNLCERPETLLGSYDVIFAKGRCALEALATGTSVVLCGQHGIGPLVTVKNLDWLRAVNFGHRALQKPLEPEAVLCELANYDSMDAASVSARIRATAGRGQMVDAVLDLYREAIEEYSVADKSGAEDEGRAAAAYLRWLAIQFKREEDLTMSSATLRLRNRLLRVPVLGTLALSVTRRAFR
jgi:hypothetical protein